MSVVNRGNLPSGDDASITVYDAGAINNATPIQRIVGNEASNTRVRQPNGIAVDTNGRIFVAQPHRTLAFAAGANGSDVPVEILDYPYLVTGWGLLRGELMCGCVKP